MERLIDAAPQDLYRAWTTNDLELWFAASGTVTMTDELGAPWFFETRFDGQRHPHYGRFLRLVPGWLIETTWITAAGTAGIETVLTVTLQPEGNGIRLRLEHAGFADAQAMAGHRDAWPLALEQLEAAMSRTSKNPPPED